VDTSWTWPDAEPAIDYSAMDVGSFDYGAMDVAPPEVDYGDGGFIGEAHTMANDWQDDLGAAWESGTRSDAPAIESPDPSTSLPAPAAGGSDWLGTLEKLGTQGLKFATTAFEIQNSARTVDTNARTAAAANDLRRSELETSSAISKARLAADKAVAESQATIASLTAGAKVGAQRAAVATQAAAQRVSAGVSQLVEKLLNPATLIVIAGPGAAYLVRKASK